MSFFINRITGYIPAFFRLIISVIFIKYGFRGYSKFWHHILCGFLYYVVGLAIASTSRVLATYSVDIAPFPTVSRPRSTLQGVHVLNDRGVHGRVVLDR